MLKGQQIYGDIVEEHEVVGGHQLHHFILPRCQVLPASSKGLVPHCCGAVYTLVPLGVVELTVASRICDC